MSVDIATLCFVGILCLVLAANVFAMMLSSLIPRESEAYSLLFGKVSPLFTGGIDHGSLLSPRIRSFLPFAASPDLSSFGRIAVGLLFASRVCLAMAALTLFGLVLSLTFLAASGILLTAHL